MKLSRLVFCSLVFGATTLAAQVAAPTAQVAAPTAQTSPAPRPRAQRTAESAITPVGKDANRHRQLLDRIKQGGIDFLLVGDSITDAWNRIGEKSYLKFAPLNPANLGVSGDRTEHVLWRLEHGEIDGIHPKAAMVMIGTNNFGQSAEEQPEWTAAGVKKILDTLRAKLPETKILLLAISPRGNPGDEIRQRIAKANQILSTYADGKTIRYMDIGKVFLDAHGNLPPNIMPDKLHPNAFGYDRWHDAVRPAIDAMMK